MKENKMSITINAVSENIPVVRVAVTSFISNLEITLDELMEIKTAVSEALTNAIEHGYTKYSGDNPVVILNAKFTSDEEDHVEIEVIDYGVGIEDIELATTPAYTSKPELEHAGMRFTIMESFMDEIIIDSEKDSGTKITLKKKLRNKKSKMS